LTLSTMSVPQTPATPGDRSEQRLIVVSNRLPVTIKKDASGKYTYKASQLLHNAMTHVD
jgi:trehalose-6-phosphate synthase